MGKGNLSWTNITKKAFHQNKSYIEDHGLLSMISCKWSSEPKIAKNKFCPTSFMVTPLRASPKTSTSGFECLLIEIFGSLQSEKDNKLSLLFRDSDFMGFHSHNTFFLIRQLEMFPKFLHGSILINNNRK